MPAQATFIADLFAPYAVAARSAPSAVDHLAALYPDEAEHITPMVGGRRAEYATGRACARAAMADMRSGAGLGREADEAIRRDDRGAPIWPPGITGSISHTEGFCAAIAAPTSTELLAVGLDIERIDRVSDRVRKFILTESEATEVAALPASQVQRRVAVAFAAKEAFYKAQYQLTSTYLGFGAVEVTLTDTTLAFRSEHAAVSSLVGRTSGRVGERDGRVIAAVLIAAAT